MFIVIAALALLWWGQTPDPTLPPADMHAAITVEGQGVQIYTCTAQDGGYQWVFQAPEATLTDPVTRHPVGMHTAGPTWLWEDGSSITGKVIGTMAATRASSVPWLLLLAYPAGTASGTLSNVVYVRRFNTEGGGAPATGCDAQHAGNALRVPYKAMYSFYKKAP